MIFEILKYVFILLIAIPFLYMVFDVIVDVMRRFYGFYRRNIKTAFVGMMSTMLK